jgi:hypothetical protein
MNHGEDNQQLAASSPSAGIYAGNALRSSPQEQNWPRLRPAKSLTTSQKSKKTARKGTCLPERDAMRYPPDLPAESRQRLVIKIAKIEAEFSARRASIPAPS